ncbi:hypothetical protein K457DRAFT_681297 [Linnemannia elongata AG-77]|uniref:Uncharacterized protein n=1 Tax=Linnemannia elongata AG-77 TaxID=1314771 RepID=A0A197JNA4_9FUNG|nr:hypothetical protein K457DRAFT_681297 [Linnemannia elongata AG-77]
MQQKKKLLLSSRQSHRHCSTSLSSLCFSPPCLASFFLFSSLLFSSFSSHFSLAELRTSQAQWSRSKDGNNPVAKKVSINSTKTLEEKKIAIYESWPAAHFPQSPMTWYMMNDEYWSRHCNFKGELIEEKIEKVETPPLSRGRYIQYAHRI